MPFTDEEKRLWHEAKRSREWASEPAPQRPAPVTSCIHCGRPFGNGEGIITDEFSLCDMCDR
jgi:hypothetical protein